MNTEQRSKPACKRSRTARKWYTAARKCTGTLVSGSAQVKSGINTLAKGAKKLSDGTKEFNDEGIQKISDVVNDDLQDVLDRLDALRSDENAYTSYAGKSDKMDGNVKFVIETEAIDND